MDNPRILIIDDDRNLRKTLSDILRIKGYETLAAEDGEQGLALLREQGANLVLIDLGLPGMSGLEVLARIKRDFPLTGGKTMRATEYPANSLRGHRQGRRLS